MYNEALNRQTIDAIGNTAYFDLNGLNKHLKQKTLKVGAIYTIFWADLQIIIESIAAYFHRPYTNG